MNILHKLKSAGLIVLAGQEQLSNPGDDQTGMFALELPGNKYRVIHKDGTASLADEHANQCVPRGMVVTALAEQLIGDKMREVQEVEWARELIDRVEQVRFLEPELNTYSSCLKAGITFHLYKEARAFYGASQ